MSLLQKRHVLLFVMTVLVLAVAILAWPQRPVMAGPPFASAQLQLTSVAVPYKTLPASPYGGKPSNVTYTVTSAQGPFCLVGFRVDAGALAEYNRGEVGQLYIYLDYIDGNGVSYQYFKLFDGATGGYTPQDIVVSQGSQICASQSIGFHATMYQAPAGAGVGMVLKGNAIVMTSAGNTVTVQ